MINIIKIYIKNTYLIGEKKTGEKWLNFVLGDQILTGLKF